MEKAAVIHGGCFRGCKVDGLCCVWSLSQHCRLVGALESRYHRINPGGRDGQNVYPDLAVGFTQIGGRTKKT